MILEDAHWIDPTSLELFGRIVERIPSLRVLGDSGRTATLHNSFRRHFWGVIIGAGGGEGTMTCAGQVYPISVGGIGIGVLGFAGGEIEGVAYNLRSPADIAGTYGAAGAGFTFVGGPQVAQLQNENGVIIQVHGVQIGLEVNLNLAGMHVAMN